MNKPLSHPPGTAASAVDPNRKPAIRLEGVAKTFVTRGGGAPVQALSDINLEVPYGSILGVIGRSGAGKSTLIRIVNGLERPSTGRVLVDGVDLASLPEPRLRPVRRSIGMIFQHFSLLSSRTAYANIALPLEIAGVKRAAIRDRVGSLLDLVGLHDQRDRYPSELSGGQKQRVGIARALATSPKVLLSDEATSALDPETTRSTLELLASINRELGLTILLITHEMSVIRAVAHEVAVIDDGTIVERGHVFDVFTRPRHTTTRSLLGAEASRSLPPYLRARLAPEPMPGGTAVIRIEMHGSHATQPIISRLSREMMADINILSGLVDEIAGQPFGNLVVGLAAEPRAVERAVAFLASNGFETQVLGYVD